MLQEIQWRWSHRPCFPRSLSDKVKEVLIRPEMLLGSPEVCFIHSFVPFQLTEGSFPKTVREMTPCIQVLAQLLKIWIIQGNVCNFALLSYAHWQPIRKTSFVRLIEGFDEKICKKCPEQWPNQNYMCNKVLSLSLTEFLIGLQHFVWLRVLYKY